MFENNIREIVCEVYATFTRPHTMHPILFINPKKHHDVDLTFCIFKRFTKSRKGMQARSNNFFNQFKVKFLSKNYAYGKSIVIFFIKHVQLCYYTKSS